MRGWLLLGAAGAAAVAWAAYGEDTPRLLEAAVGGGCKGPSQPDLAQALARKWGPLFGAPYELMMVVARIESGYRPTCVNVNERAMSRGGAWGMYQQTLSTAKGHAQALASDGRAAVQQTLRKWTGKGTSLLDADLCALFAARQLGKLWGEFPVFEQAIGAYHQGAAKIRSMNAAGKRIPADLPPNGKLYVTRALDARGKIA